MKADSANAEVQKPDTGVDRTLIRRLLAMSPAERIRMLAVEARNMNALLARIRQR